MNTKDINTRTNEGLSATVENLLREEYSQNGTSAAAVDLLFLAAAILGYHPPSPGGRALVVPGQPTRK